MSDSAPATKKRSSTSPSGPSTIAGKRSMGDSTYAKASEATHFAVCWHEEVKHSLADDRLRPVHAVVDLRKGLTAFIEAMYEGNDISLISYGPYTYR